MLPAELTWCSSYERNCSRSRLRRWMKRFGDTTPVRRFWLLICRIEGSNVSSQHSQLQRPGLRHAVCCSNACRRDKQGSMQPGSVSSRARWCLAVFQLTRSCNEHNSM